MYTYNVESYDNKIARRLTILTCHGEHADDDADVPSRQHHLFAVRLRPARLRLASRPHAHRQDEHVEEDDGGQTEHVNRHCARRKSQPAEANEYPVFIYGVHV